ncbi:MAG: GNAT family N-acetyltransferase, partial [Waterburya sp.]
FPEDNSAEILSIFIVSAYRRQKIGTALLTFLEQELHTRGCITVKLFYKTGKPTSLALERLLESCNWSTPRPWDIVCESDLDTIAKAPWFQIKFRIPFDMTIFPWAEITDRERIVIKQTQESEPWFDESRNPFRNENNMEPLNSLGLRYKGLVVGWMLTERMASNTIYYNCMFVRRDLQKLGRGIYLFINAIRLQAKAEIPKGIWRVNFNNSSMLRFVKKHMIPYTNSLEEVSCSSKLLVDI